MRLLDPLATPCLSCGLGLCSAILREGATFFVIYFHDGEWVERCPRCHEKLDGNAMKPRRGPPTGG
jgi:hypothetical protein